MQTGSKAELTLLYDGLCPICRKEVAWLKRLNTAKKLAFQDINATDFNAAQYGISYELLMAEIHAQKDDGQLIKGMPVFRALYQTVGLGWLLAPTDWPILRPLFDWLYQCFAQHRGKLGTFLARGQSCERCVK
jgi:predicted DCC family thiol-disulfide oxidoreductase YuxK